MGQQNIECSNSVRTPESVEGNNPSVKLSKSNEDDISNLTINFENFLERHDDGVRRHGVRAIANKIYVH